MTQQKSRFVRARERVEVGFERWADRVSARPWLVIGLCAAFFAALALQMRHIEFDTSPEEFCARASVFLFASMSSLRIFGGVTALAIILTFVADVIVAPALVTLATRNKRRAGA